MTDLSALAENLASGEFNEVKALTQKALDEGIPPREILNEGLIKGMDVVREEFKNGELYIPKALLAGKAMHAGVDILRPALASSGVEPIGKVVLGTVKGDLHDINKNLVAVMLEGAGFEVLDLGVDVPLEKFVESAKYGADIIAMSAFLVTAMFSMKAVLEALEEAGLRDKIKTMIVGIPVSRYYADLIGADGYAQSAASAVDKAKQLMGLASL
jgi:5-methyltetrahydrofolate--homocysteine methyltransferase